jgi:hypothetical protein
MPSSLRFGRRSLLFAACLARREPPGVRAEGSASVEVAVVARLGGLGLADAPALVAAARIILPPGADAAAVAPAGARVIAVEAGAVEMLSTTQGAAWLSPRPALAGSAPVETTPILAGSALPVPATAVEGVRNDGGVPAVALDVALMPAGLPMPPPAFIAGTGVEFRLLGSGVIEAPPPRVDLVLRRIDLPPGAEMPADLGEGIALLLADRGRIDLVVSRGRIEVSIAAGGIGPAGRARPVDAGGLRTLPASSSAFVPADAAVRVLAVGPTPARALLVSLSPSAARSGFDDGLPQERRGEWHDERADGTAPSR